MAPQEALPSLYEKIYTLRTELDKLLDKEGTSSDHVLELSKKLDKYIEKYYRVQEVM